MEFRLLYSGQVLGSGGSNTRPEMKHAIRRAFHPQLKRLWETNENLHNVQHMEGHDEALRGLNGLSGLAHRRHLEEMEQKRNSEKHAYRNEGREILLKQWERCGFRFLPLVSERFTLRCSLDILFLRPQEPGFVIQGGDIDNRIKTIFDALRLPNTLSETGGMGPQEGEDPFYCLLEDDKLISEVRVQADQLLLLPHEQKLSPNDAFLVIHAKVKPIAFSMEGLRFT